MLDQFRFHQGQFSVELANFKLTGSDVVSFLNAQSTYDIDQLQDKHFHLAAFLDPQGRVETYGYLLREGESFCYLVPKSLSEASSERLNRFLVSEDVEITQAQNETWFVLIGPEARPGADSFKGQMFDEEAFLARIQSRDVVLIPQKELECWRILTGSPSFDGSDYSKEIINNLRLYDLAVTPNKGCYPGQETVSKIATRRGAAYAPVLLEVESPLEGGEISNFHKRIGRALPAVGWRGKWYLPAHLLRDFRVEGMRLSFDLAGSTYSGTVRYYPLISGNREAKSRELFYEASTLFMQEKLAESEDLFRLSIKLDPKFADAYEGLGVMLGRQERFQEAVEIMQELSAVDPGSVLAHTNLSLFLMRLGRIEEAEEQKSLATVKSFQKFGEEAKLKAELEREQKAKQDEWLKRESMFQQVLEIDEEDTLANYGLGSIAIEKGEWERGRQHLEKVLKADPKYSVAYLALGKAYSSLGLRDLAKETWINGVKIAAAKGDLMPANQMQSELDRL